MDAILTLPFELLKNLHIAWSLMLLLVRFSAMMTVIPGIGGGARGMIIRMPAVVVMSISSSVHAQYAALPADWAVMGAALVSEALLGMLLGALPALIIAGVENAAQLATTTMGLGAAQLFDPNTDTSVSSLGKLFGDVFVCMFLVTGGHHTVIYAVSGLGGTIVPGTYMVNESSIALLIDRTGDIFAAGAMLSAPVVVAILLTNFVMGLISRAVPQVNIFIINFPLTIGIGLVLSMLSLPEIVDVVERDFARLDQEAAVVVEGTARAPAPAPAPPAATGIRFNEFAVEDPR